jgi:hypothetical protein
MIDLRHRPAFRTKLEFAVELLRWAVTWLKHWGQPLWVVVDRVHRYSTLPHFSPGQIT